MAANEGTEKRRGREEKKGKRRKEMKDISRHDFS